MAKFFACLLLVSTLFGCAQVRTNITTFHGEGSEDRGAIIVLPLNDEQRDSLAFKAVSQRVATRLSVKGYRLARTREDAKLVAFISYGIDNGKTSVTSAPVYGRTGGGTSQSQGTITGSGGSSATYRGTTTTMTTYGVVGIATSAETEYKRDVNIDIYNVTGAKPVKAYELRAFSIGSCGNIHAIIDSIIDGMFEEFPGQSGKTTQVDVKWDGKC
jgi:hypothetical protein